MLLANIPHYMVRSIIDPFTRPSMIIPPDKNTVHTQLFLTKECIAVHYLPQALSVCYQVLRSLDEELRPRVSGEVLSVEIVGSWFRL